MAVVATNTFVAGRTFGRDGPDVLAAIAVPREKD
jgi:hypothetical protein